MKIYVVGGAVRDFLLNRTPTDLDFAVEADSYQDMLDGLTARGAKILRETPQFVTVRARIAVADLGPGNGDVKFGGIVRELYDMRPDGTRKPTWLIADFTLCRAEAMYHDKRHPSEVTTASLRVDLSRRDFTINAMAMSEEGELIDPYNGQLDLQSRRINTVGEAKDRFTEDPLRMLRALRFMVKLHFGPSLGVDKALCSSAMTNEMATLPIDRVVNELRIMFAHDWYATTKLLFNSYPHIAAMLNAAYPEFWIKPSTELR